MSFVFAAVCSVLFLSPSTHAYSLSISADDVYVEITSGETSVKKADIEVTTNCRAGYNFSISTTTSPSLYLNGNGNSSAVFTAVNGTNALSNSNNTNKWGYYYNSNQSTVPTDSSTFLPLSTTQTTLRTPSQTASPSSDIDDDFSIYYGVNAGASVAPGLYYMANSGKINYYATADTSCDVVNIAYDGNNATAGTMGAVGTGVIHTGVKDGDAIDLIASNFNKTGYGFAGWSTDPNAGAKLIDNNSSNNPVVYGPQETVTLPQGFINNDTDNDGIVKLYAVWIPSQGNLQGWTGCANLDTATYDSTTGALDLTKNSVTALTDQRDNQVYAVARLADGKCWMIENLRLDNTHSDNSIGFLAQNYGGQFAGLANAEPAWAHNISTANSLYSTNGANNTINIGATNASYRFPRYNNTNTSARATNPTANTEAMYSYGNYYTWAAAVADTTAYATNNQSAASTSLCPTSWHLPTGGMAYASGSTSGVNVTGDTSTFREFYNLGYKVMNEVKTAYEDTPNSGQSRYTSNTTNLAGKTATTAFRSYPSNFIYSGYVYNGSVSSRGDNGFYWSSTTYSAGYAYGLYLKSSYANPGTYSIIKYNGMTVRCVASDPETFTLTYNANGGSGAPSAQSTTANGSATFTISSTTPTRSGYTFAGWIDENGNEAQPGGTFRTKDPNSVLYARWTNNSCNPSATTIGTENSSTDAVCLQDVKLSMKSSLPTATSTTGTYNLIDARDGQSYTVAKLPDGNLWLTKNLNYGNSSDTLLTSYDTDLPSNTTFMSPASTSTFSTGADYYTTPQIQSNVTTYGGYYNYAAAIASKNAYSTTDQNITTSICPKGWDLPTSASYTYLKSSASLTNYSTASVAPYSFTYGGYKNGANFTNQTTRGDLWSSTNRSSAYGQGLYITSSAFTISTTNNSNFYKYYGKTVRCIASNGTTTVNYDANGGSGTIASQTGDINSITISSNTFTAPTGYQFKNWNTAADGSGTSVAAGAALSSIASNGDTITLYAQWNPIYKITYVNNCATFNTGCTASTSNGTSVLNIILSNNPSTGTETGTLGATNVWTQTNYKITSWNTAADGSGTSYVPSSTFTVPAGSVPGDGITLYAQWTPSYTIVFDGNGATNATTGMRNSSEYSVKFTNVSGGDEIELLAPNYYKTGYGFAGWSFDSSATPGGSATIYGPNETITAPVAATTGETKTLYAIWVASAGTMQNWNGCSSMNVGDVTALNDIRDSTGNNVYTVGKLADGNCWMMENLRLNNNSTNPNWGDNNLSQGFGGAFSGLAASESTNFSASTTANTLYSTTNITGSDQGYRFPRYNNNNTAAPQENPSYTRNYVNTAYPSNTPTNNAYQTQGVYSYGNYYTWAAAAANTQYFNNDTTVNTSICPTGWKLPSGGNYITNTNDYYELATIISDSEPEYGSAGGKYWNGTGTPVAKAFKKYPNNFVYSGLFNNSSASNRGGVGRYWTSSTYMLSSHYLGIQNGLVVPAAAWVASIGGYTKYYGQSVRCISSTYTVILNGNGATTAGSSSTTVGLGSTTLGTITNPQKSYSVSGWTTPSGNNASGATVNGGTAPGTLNSNYTLNGWYKESATTNLIASGATTPVLQANTDYTDANSKWTNKGNVTLYAGWTSQSVTLPTITKAGYDCGWTETPTGATSITYASGGSITPSTNKTLYGVCVETTYTITFNANGGTGTMNNQSIPVSISTKLNSNEFTAPSIGSSYQNANGTTINGTAGKLWTFWGWNTNAAGTGDWYKDRESVQGLASANQTITLYAQWKQATLDDMLTATSGTKTITHSTMQDMSAAICFNSDITTKAVLEAANKTGAVTLTDNRDGTTRSYDVSKLADGNCWMTTNLALGTTSEVILTSDDTNLDEGTTFTLPAGTTTSSTTNTAARIRLTNNNGTDANGVYYSWAAAVASTTSRSDTPTTSICPKNWDLPTDAQFTALSSASSYSSSNPTTDLPSQFKIDGGFTNGATFYQTTYNHYWSATSYSTSAAWGARTSTSTLTTSRNTGTTIGGNKYYRKNIRCVASSGKVTIHYDKNNSSATGNMADQTNIEINAGAISSNAYTLTDHRFKNWNTAPDGNGTSVAAGATLSSLGLYDGQEITLYAQWNPVYYIAFNANESSVDGSITATGTMTNQTVVRDTATAINTNTFALTGYIFRGWNTSADGTGTFYSDNHKVINLTTTGNTITLYAVWVRGALLDTGSNVNRKLKRLAGNSSAIFSTQDTAITAIVRSNNLPNGFTASDENTISDSSSPSPIYAWYNSANTTIYYYSEETNILMNKASSALFYEMRALSNLSTISTWDTAKVTQMGDMFRYTGYNASSFVLDLSSWIVSSGATSTQTMFNYAGCNATTFALNLSSWDTSSLTSTSQMFYRAGFNSSSFTLNLSYWDTSSVTNMSSMFAEAGASATTWSVIGLSSWDTSSLTNLNGTFHSAGGNAATFTLDLSSWDVSNVKIMSLTFAGAGFSATTWSIGNLSSWDTSSVTDMNSMFSGAGRSATTWSIGDISSWDTSNVTSMDGMFSSAGYNASSFNLDLSSWDISNVKYLGRMFRDAGYNASSFTLNLSSWDTSSVTNMDNMFSSAGNSATTWSVTIPKTNDGTASGPITNTTSRLYGNTTSVYVAPPSGKSFTLAN